MDTRDPILIDHTNVSSPDLKTVADYINKTVGAKVIEPDDQLENSLRRIAALPDKDPTTTRLVMEEVDGDGGLRMDRSERTKPANNQRNQNPKPDAPRPAEKPTARKPMRASEGTESDDFVGEQDMDTRQAMEFAERMQGKALDSLTRMAEMNKPQPPASITVAPTIQNYDVKEIAQAIRDIPAPQVTVSPTVDVKPNVVNVAPTPVTFNVAQAPAADVKINVAVDTTPIANELRPLAGLRDAIAGALLAVANAVQGQKPPVVNVTTPPAIVHNVMPAESVEEQDVIRDPRTQQIKGTKTVIKHKYGRN